MGGARLGSDSPRAALAACDSFARLVLCGSAMASTAGAKIQAARAVSTTGPSLRCAWLRPTFAQPQHGCVVLLNTSGIETIVRDWSRMLGSVMHELSGWPNMEEQELDDESCRRLGFPEEFFTQAATSDCVVSWSPTCEAVAFSVHVRATNCVFATLSQQC